MSMAKLVGSRGREVLRGVLLHRKKGSGSWKVWKVNLCVDDVATVACPYPSIINMQLPLVCVRTCRYISGKTLELHFHF